MNNWDPNTGPLGTVNHAVINTVGAVVTISDPNRAALSTSISAGELLIEAEGRWTSAVMLTRGRLTGNGIVVGTVTNDGGSVAPSGSAGFLVSSGGAQNLPEPSCLSLSVIGGLSFLFWLRSARRFSRLGLEDGGLFLPTYGESEDGGLKFLSVILIPTTLLSC